MHTAARMNDASSANVARAIESTRKTANPVATAAGAQTQKTIVASMPAAS